MRLGGGAGDTDEMTGSIRVAEQRVLGPNPKVSWKPLLVQSKGCGFTLGTASGSQG